MSQVTSFFLVVYFSVDVARIQKKFCHRFPQCGSGLGKVAADSSGPKLRKQDEEARFPQTSGSRIRMVLVINARRGKNDVDKAEQWLHILFTFFFHISLDRTVEVIFVLTHWLINKFA